MYRLPQICGVFLKFAQVSVCSDMTERHKHLQKRLHDRWSDKTQREQHIPGTSQEHPRNIPGTSQEHPRNVPGTSQERPRNILGTHQNCHKTFQKHHTLFNVLYSSVRLATPRLVGGMPFALVIHNVPGTFQTRSRNIPGTFQVHPRNIPGTSQEHPRNNP